MSFQDQFNAEAKKAAASGRRFKFRRDAVEDRAASMREGHVMYRDRDICEVYKVGGNGEMVEWIVEELDIRGEKFAEIKPLYDAWKAGVEDGPVNGTDLRLWPAVSKAEVENLRFHSVYTVEELATIPDNLLPNVGMGARALQLKAQAWLNAANSVGRVAEQIAALTVEMAALKAANAEKDAAIADLQAQVEQTTPRRQKRAARMEEEAA